MCDLVKDETERIDSRFLEPACGDGNFLAEILERKLAAVTRTYAKNPNDWEKTFKGLEQKLETGSCLSADDSVGYTTLSDILQTTERISC